MPVTNRCGLIMAPAVNLLAAMGPLQNAVHVDACWGLPVVTALSSFLLSIPQLNSGIFFVLYIDEMGATREAASWPKSIILGVTQLTGLLVGAIQHKVPILTLQLVGASLAPLSIIVSAFSPNMLWMSVTFGFFYGIFRDAGGSYDNLYRICGGINLFATILLSAQACFDVRKARTLKMT
ncbi:uncharacterized protein LOC144144710 isoform X3 [Haemaphysalis longicornis]